MFKTCFIALISCVTVGLAQNKNSYRVCIPKENIEACESMLKNSSANIKCATAIDKISCIETISKEGADFVPLEPEEIYVADQYNRDAFRIISEIRSKEFADRNFRYEPVAIVRKSSGIFTISDLKGKRSCHTGFGRNAGWKIPFSHLLDKQELSKYCGEIKATTTEKDLYAVSNYFSSACAPGSWLPEKDKDKELKAKYPNLCALCNNPGSCSRDDKFGGYSGALDCLTLNHGDVAWTKLDAVLSYFNLSSGTPSHLIGDYQFLCWDGSSLPLNTVTPCSWAKRPWSAYVASNRLSQSDIKDLQQQLSLLHGEGVSLATTPNAIPSWLQSVLEIGRDSPKSLNFDVISHVEVHTAKSTTLQDYLNDGKNYSVTISSPSCASTASSIKFCVKSDLEKSKCLALQLAAQGRRILPKIDCVVGKSNLDCIEQVSKGDADLVNLTPKDASWSHQNKYNIVPILSEVEAFINPEDYAPYRYAIAVIRSSDSNIYRNISALKGKKSCHGSVRNLAGWNVPIRKLERVGLIAGPTCGLPIRMSQFFGNHSCVPGIKNVATTMPWLPVKDLCSVCVGDGSTPPNNKTICSDSSAERYFGPSGALACLEEGAGDVAFLDHVGLNRTISSMDTTANANATSFLLLCPTGSTMEISNYQNCNWGRIPSNQILVRGGDSDENKILREDIRQTFLKISDTFRPAGKLEVVLKLFGSYYGNSDLLFQDSSVNLCDYQSVNEYEDLINDFDYCTTSSAIVLFGCNSVVGLMMLLAMLRQF